MQIGMIGLGRMGANIVRRLMRHGHACVVLRPRSGAGAERWRPRGRGRGASLAELVTALGAPRVSFGSCCPSGERRRRRSPS